MTTGRFPLRKVTVVLCVLLLAGPTVFVLISSFGSGSQIVFPPKGITGNWYIQLFENSANWHALLNSLYVGFISVVITSIAGVPAALGLVRLGTRTRVVVLLLLLLALTTPPVVQAFGFYDIFTSAGIIEHLTAVGFAVAIVNFPFMLWAVTAAVEDEDPELGPAAATLGADPVEQFLFVRLPLLMPGVITGALLVFVLSMTDFVVSEVLTSLNDQTLPGAGLCRPAQLRLSRPRRRLRTLHCRRGRRADRGPSIRAHGALPLRQMTDLPPFRPIGRPGCPGRPAGAGRPTRHRHARLSLYGSRARGGLPHAADASGQRPDPAPHGGARRQERVRPVARG